MNGLQGFIIGMACGMVSTFVGIMVFAKRMDKKEKKMLIKKARERWKK